MAPVPEGKSVKNRLHLDLRADGTTAVDELERLLGLGTVEVHGLDVTHEADDETHAAHADVDLAICPPGRKAGGERCSGQR